MERFHAIIHGKVQGVGFRYFLRKQATKHKLLGWTRNRRDQTVEVVVEGNLKNLEEFLVSIRIGPPYSEVFNINTTWEDAKLEFSNFEILPTS